MGDSRNRFAFQIAYKGTAYRGWQRQDGVVTVQETIEEALSDVMHQDISIWGCGRTDAGVHASKYFFHSDIQGDLDLTSLNKLNYRLPDDIVVQNIFKVAREWNAQRSAVKRTYHYHLHYEKRAFKSDLSAFYRLTNFNIELINHAVRLLKKYHDFQAFCKTPEKHNHTRCVIQGAKWFHDELDKSMRFEISADRFLRGMIRILVHYLIQVGLERMEVSDFEKYLESRVRPPHLKFAHPQGLYLHNVEYPVEFSSIIE